MREVERIDNVLAVVAEAWRSKPDLRLGQLIFNAVADASHNPVDPCPALFYVEDEDLAAALALRHSRADPLPD